MLGLCVQISTADRTHAAARVAPVWCSLRWSTIAVVHVNPSGLRSLSNRPFYHGPSPARAPSLPGSGQWTVRLCRLCGASARGLICDENVTRLSN